MSGLSIHETLDAPFYGGDASTSVDDRSLPVSINGRAFMLDLESNQFQRRSVQLLNTQQAQGGGDTSQTPPEVWRRSWDSWHLGAGQERFDREDSQPYRFHESDGVDPWSKYGLSLLNDTTTLRSLGTGESAILRTIGYGLFVAVGSTVDYYATVSAPLVTHGCPANVLDMVTDGENLYVLCSNGVIEKRNAAGVWSTYLTRGGLDVTKAMIAYVKGFLLLGDGPTLLNINNPGTPVTVYTHPLATWWWRAATAGLTCIYVLGGIGDRWHVHRVTVTDTGSALNPPIVSASLPEGEIATALGSYLGYVLIGIHYGWRFATSDSNGDVTFGQVIRTPGPVLCFEGQDRFVWFGLSRPDSETYPGLLPSFAGLGRADLSSFVQTLTPAAACDLVGDDFGVTRSVVTAGEAAGPGIRVFSVDEVGVFVESTDLRPNGWITLGSVNFNSTDKKMGLYVQSFHDALLGGMVYVDVSNDLTSPDFVEIGMSSVVGSVALGNMAYARAFNSAQVRVRLARDEATPTLGPRVNRVEFRALNVPGQSTEWRIPLIVSESIVSGGSVHARNVDADNDFLTSLVQTREVFTYREGDRSWQLHAFDFIWIPHHLADGEASFNGTFVLVARELT